jgi:predicted Zn-dependent protease
MSKLARPAALLLLALALLLGAGATALALRQRRQIHRLEGMVLVLRARQAMAENNRPEARALLELALARDPAVEGARIELVRLDIAERQPRRATIRANEEVALRPNSALAHMLLGTALVLNEMPAQGEKALRRAVELDPLLPGASLNLSQFYRERDQSHLALGVVEAYLAKRPTEPSFRFRRAMILLELGQGEALAQEVRQKLEARQATPVDLVALAGALLAAKKPDEAQKFLAEASRALPASEFQAMLQDRKLRTLLPKPPSATPLPPAPPPSVSPAP